MAIKMEFACDVATKPKMTRMMLIVHRHNMDENCSDSAGVRGMFPQKINAIKDLRNAAREETNLTSIFKSSNLTAYDGLVDAKNFVEEFTKMLRSAWGECDYLIMRLDPLKDGTHDREMILLLSNIAFQVGYPFSVHSIEFE